MSTNLIEAEIKQDSEEFKKLFEKLAQYYGCKIGETMEARLGLHLGNVIEAKTFVVNAEFFSDDGVIGDLVGAPTMIFPHKLYGIMVSGVDVRYKFMFGFWYGKC